MIQPTHKSRRCARRYISRLKKLSHPSHSIPTPTKPSTHPTVLSGRKQNKLAALATHGFWANPNLPTWKAVQTVLLSMPLPQFFNLHKNNQIAFHNLCTALSPPTGTDQLLWNGLKYCIEKPLPKPNLKKTFERLRADIRLKYFWKQLGEPDTGEHCRKLYIKSSFEAGKASPPIEDALDQYELKLTQAVKHNLSRQRRQHNLPQAQRLLLKTLPTNPNFIVMTTDKGVGPAIMERSLYKQRCLQDHLLDTSTYQQLTKSQADGQLKAATFQFRLLVDSNRNKLPKLETTYFDRSFQKERRTPQFYCIPKVHKIPWKMRPIVSCINSRMGDLSKWVDYQLQRVVHLCPCYLKDSKSLIKKLRALGTLPSTAVIVIADAVSMYTNIDTTHGLQVIEAWLALHAHELPVGFPTPMVLKALKLVMFNNVFQFDDTYWLQKTGTAMGTNLACVYATIYFSYLEETKLLRVYAHQQVVPERLMPQLPAQLPTFSEPPLLLHARLIDDAIQIWDMAKLPGTLQATLHHHMEQQLQFGQLDWEAAAPSKSVDFLDLTITLDPDGGFSTKTYVKAMNLHLYIPPASAHPKGVIKSLVFGTIQRYWTQNSKMEDFLSASQAFLGHLLNRGHTMEALAPLFKEVAELLATKARRAPAPEDPQWEPIPKSSHGRFFIHWEYHPRDVGRKTVRQLFEETLSPVLSESGLPVRQLTVAYSTPKSIAQCLTKTQLEEPDGIRVSSYIEPAD